jgi:hypothetical protein
MLIHITERRRLDSIKTHGLVSPAAAADLGYVPVFGSKGSNRKVVQLLDLEGVRYDVIRTQFEALRDDADANEGNVADADLHVLVLDDALRDDPAFVSSSAVAHRCRPRELYGTAVRQIPGLEASYEGTIPWTSVREVVPYREFMARLR